MNKVYITAAVVVISLGLVFSLTRNESSELDTNELSLDTQDNAEQPDNTKKMQKPELTIDQSKNYTATLSTTEGDIVIELDAKNTPITANNFVYLAENEFYNDTIFHRVISDFMIQGGDPEGTGRGGPGYRFEDEEAGLRAEYTRGTIAMANAGPDTNGSQFFIMHKDYDLAPNYVIFGKVVEGMDVVDKIANAEVKPSFGGEMSTPVTPVTVKSVTISSE